MYRFPKDLYADVRIQETSSIWLNIQDGDLRGDGDELSKKAIIRVFDGRLWYSSSTSDLDHIQDELDHLAALAAPNPDIYEHPVVRRFEVHREKRLSFDGADDNRKVSREQWKELLDGYIAACPTEAVPEISSWYGGVSAGHSRISFYSSKGAEIVQDFQNCWLNLGYAVTVDHVTTFGGKSYSKFTFDELRGHEAEMLAERERVLDFAKHAVDIEPGEYTCVLAPLVTAMFTHESFGHKSEADYMLNDQALRDEWVMGKKVGSEKISICDSGDMPNHGYCPYDDEGTKARETWLIRDGVLTGRLHNAESAAALNEELTGNARAVNASYSPIVRMTNTYLAAGSDDPEEMVRGVRDGLYIYDVSYGTGQSTFTIKPGICYRIRDGKICEPVRVNVLTGSVFQTLFDVDAVGTDLELFDTYTCGKNGQTVNVSAGGPSIRVKKLTAS